jgi:hypothetical protein
MSDTSFEEFLQAVLDRNDLQEQLKTEINQRGIETSYQLADLAVEMGGERGFDFSREDARVSIDELIMAGQRGAELTEEELARVTGGAGMAERAGEYASKASIGREVTQSFRLDKLKIGR